MTSNLKNKDYYSDKEKYYRNNNNNMDKVAPKGLLR